MTQYVCNFILVSETPIETFEAEFKEVEGSKAIKHLLSLLQSSPCSCRQESLYYDYYIQDLEIWGGDNLVTVGCDLGVVQAINTLKVFDRL